MDSINQFIPFRQQGTSIVPKIAGSSIAVGGPVTATTLAGDGNAITNLDLSPYSIGALGNVDETGVSNNDVLAFDGTNWVPTTLNLDVTIGDTIVSSTQGSIFFAGAAGVLAQDNANLFWDDTNNRLGVGTLAPGATLDVQGAQVNLGNFTFNTDQAVGVTEDNFVLTYDNTSGEISLEASSGGILIDDGTQAANRAHDQAGFDQTFNNAGTWSLVGGLGTTTLTSVGVTAGNGTATSSLFNSGDIASRDGLGNAVELQRTQISYDKTADGQYEDITSAGVTVGTYIGSGSPEGVVTANAGSIYRDKDNGELYRKDAGAGNTGWQVLGGGGGVAGSFLKVVSVAQQIVAAGGDLAYGATEASQGTNITFNGTTGFTLRAGSTYKLMANIPYVADNGGTNHFCYIRWHDGTSEVGQNGGLDDAAAFTTETLSMPAHVVVSPTVDTTYTVRVVNANAGGAVIGNTTFNQLPWVMIEEISAQAIDTNLVTPESTYRYSVWSSEDDTSIDGGDNIEIGNLFVPSATDFTLMQQNGAAPTFPSPTTMQLPVDMDSVSIEFHFNYRRDGGSGDVNQILELTKNGVRQTQARAYVEAPSDFNQVIIKYEGQALATDVFQINVTGIASNSAAIDRCSMYIKQLPTSSVVMPNDATAAYTEWTSYGPLNIGGSTTAPTKGTVVSDTAYYKVVGRSLFIRYTYGQSGPGAAGSGDYLFPIPAGFTIDTSVLDLSAAIVPTVLGSGQAHLNGVERNPGNVHAFDANNLMMYIADGENTMTPVGSTWFAMNGGSPLGYSFLAEVPII